MTLEDDIAWLTENTLTWSLEINPERTVYEPRSEYLAHTIPDENDNVRGLVEAPAMFEVRAYPTTPIGFVQIRDTTADRAIKRLRRALEE